MSLTIGARLGPYEVVAPIGAGGMGEVYRARDTALQRNVALKVLPDLVAHDPEHLARFQREAQALASLNHPHIAQVYGFESAGDVRVLVMEFVPGETLDARLRASGSGLPAAEVVAVARQISEALEAAHEQGVVHRDLKPANVKVTPDGSVKVLDFGLAKLAGAPGSGLQTPGGLQAVGPTQSPTMASPAMVTGAGMLLGTAAYMAPEQARGKAVDKRADIWGFGCVMFELLCGRPAFEGETVTDVLSAVVAKEPDWNVLPASTPGHLRALIERCLLKDPRARLRDIGEARLALDLPALTQAASASKSVQPWRERAAWTTAVIGVLAADADEADAKWMPDSRTIVFGPRREGAGPLVRMVLDSTEPAIPLEGFEAEEPQYPASLSREGGVLAFVRGGFPFWMRLPGSKPEPLQEVPPGLSRPRVSPDGRWMLYEGVSGQREVYLLPLPPTGARWPVSRDGGTWARWHPNGREIYFIGPDDAMMAVAFQATPAVQLSPPVRLFQTRIAQPTRSGVHANYDVAPDGRFLIVENTAPAEQSSSLRIIVNWQSLLPPAR
jgi:hypothetical protein